MDEDAEATQMVRLKLEPHSIRGCALSAQVAHTADVVETFLEKRTRSGMEAMPGEAEAGEAYQEALSDKAALGLLIAASRLIGYEEANQSILRLALRTTERMGDGDITGALDTVTATLRRQARVAGAELGEWPGEVYVTAERVPAEVLRIGVALSPEPRKWDRDICLQATSTPEGRTKCLDEIDAELERLVTETRRLRAATYRRGCGGCGRKWLPPNDRRRASRRARSRGPALTGRGVGPAGGRPRTRRALA